MLNFGGQDILHQGRVRAPQQPGRSAGQHSSHPGEPPPGHSHYTAEQVPWSDRNAESGAAPGAAMDGLTELGRHAQSSEPGNGMPAAANVTPIRCDGDPSNSMHVARPPGGAPVVHFPPSRPWPCRPPPHHPYRGASQRHPYYAQYPRHPPYNPAMHPYGAAPPPLVGRRQHLGFPPPHMPYSVPPLQPGYGVPPEEEMLPRAFSSPFLAPDAQAAVLGPGAGSGEADPAAAGALEPGPVRSQHTDGGILRPPQQLSASANSEAVVGAAGSGGSAATRSGATAAAAAQPPSGSYPLAPLAGHMYNPPYGPPYRPRHMMYSYAAPPQPYYGQEEMPAPYGRRLAGSHSLPLPGYGASGYGPTGTPIGGGAVSGSAGGAPPPSAAFPDGAPAVGAPPSGDSQPSVQGEPGGPNSHPFGTDNNPPYGTHAFSASIPMQLPPPPPPQKQQLGACADGGIAAAGEPQPSAAAYPNHHPHQAATAPFSPFTPTHPGLNHAHHHHLHHHHQQQHPLDQSHLAISDPLRRAYSADLTEMRMVPGGGAVGGAMILCDGGAAAAATADVIAQVNAELPLPLPELLAHLAGSPSPDDADEDEQLRAELHGFIGDLATEGYDGSGGGGGGAGAAAGTMPSLQPQHHHEQHQPNGLNPQQQHIMQPQHMQQLQSYQAGPSQVGHGSGAQRPAPMPAVLPQQQQQQHMQQHSPDMHLSQQHQQQQFLNPHAHLQQHQQHQLQQAQAQTTQVHQQPQPQQGQEQQQQQMAQMGLGWRGPNGRGRGRAAAAATAAAVAAGGGPAGRGADSSEAGAGAGGAISRISRDGGVGMAALGYPSEQAMVNPASGLLQPTVSPWDASLAAGLIDPVGIRGALPLQPSPPIGGAIARHPGQLQHQHQHLTHGLLTAVPDGVVPAGYSAGGGGASNDNGEGYPAGEVDDGVRPAGGSAGELGDGEADDDGDADGDVDAEGAGEDSWVPGGGSGGGGGRRRMTEEGEGNQRRPRRRISVRRFRGGRTVTAAQRRESTAGGAAAVAAAAATVAAGAVSAASGDELQLGARPTLEQLLSQSVDTVVDLDVLGDLEPQTVSALLEKVQRKGKGGRAPAEDPRLDPSIDPRKARRILANRISAARSKLKQKLILEGLKARYQQLLSSKNEFSRELAELKRSCRDLEARNRGMAIKLKAGPAPLCAQPRRPNRT